MNKRLNVIFAATCGFLVAIFVFVNNSEMFRNRTTVLAQNHDASDQQVTGPYDVVKDWPKPMATLFPEEKGWTLGSTQAIFARIRIAFLFPCAAKCRLTRAEVPLTRK